MVIEPHSKIVRTAVIYDGGFFSRVSDYYAYHHERGARLDINGLHRFVERNVADLEGVDPRYCQIVDAHYFRGRFGARETEAAGKLLAERQFDEVLMRAGVITHYLPNIGGRERGIDVWLALEALELAILKRFDVIALIAGDTDLLPLVRKLVTFGTRVALLNWDFDFTDDAGNQRTTRTSQALIDEATYTIPMSDMIEDRAPGDDPLVDGLFLSRGEEARSAVPPAAPAAPVAGSPAPAAAPLSPPQPVQSPPPARPALEADDVLERFLAEHEVGDIVEGPVVGIKDYGAFVQLDEGLDGLLHISEISEEFVEHPADVLREDEVVRARIINIEPEQGRIGLSMRRA